MKRLTAALLVVLMVFTLVSCGEKADSPKENATTQGVYLKDMYADKSQYRPSEPVTVTTEFENTSGKAFSGSLSFVLKRFGEKVDSYDSQKVTLTADEKKELTFSFTPPTDDFRGYSLEATLSENDKTVDYAMHAIDVSSDWNRYARMGYLTKFHKQKNEVVENNLDWLSKFHITGLFYYDHINAHDEPLAGTVENPDEKWNSSANLPVDGATLEYIRTYANEKNIMNFAYNLIYGGFDDYREKGMSEEWGIYKDKNHSDQDYHPMHETFKTLKLWLFDPGNPGFQNFYVDIHKPFFQAQKWDGMILDSLSRRPYSIYDYNGNPLKLDDRYAELFEKFRTEIGVKVMFNSSDGYGKEQIGTQTQYDILFGEIYTNSHPSYYTVKEAIDEDYGYTKGLKGASYPAYMHFDNAPMNFRFNFAGVTFFNSVLNACGGNHLELGDRNMLQVVHYPANKMKMDETLEAATRRQYDFAVAYQEVLRGPGLTETKNNVKITDRNTSRMGSKGNIWVMTKANSELDMEIIHLINFETISTTNWSDPKGKQTAPGVIENAAVRYYTDRNVKQLCVGSPDLDQGILNELSFKKGSDDRGKYIDFTLPSLEYWDMILVK